MAKHPTTADDELKDDAPSPKAKKPSVEDRLAAIEVAVGIRHEPDADA